MGKKKKLWLPGGQKVPGPNSQKKAPVQEPEPVFESDNSLILDDIPDAARYSSDEHELYEPVKPTATVRVNVKQRYVSEAVARMYEGKPVVEPEGNVVSWKTPANLIDYDISFEEIQKKKDKQIQNQIMTTGTNPNFVPLGPTLPKLDAWNYVGDKGAGSSSDSYHDAYDGDGEPDDDLYEKAANRLMLSNHDEFPSLVPKRVYQEWEAREPVMVTHDEFKNINIDDVAPGESCIVFDL